MFFSPVFWKCSLKYRYWITLNFQQWVLYTSRHSIIEITVVLHDFFRSSLETVTISLQFWTPSTLSRPDMSRSLSSKPVIRVCGLNYMDVTSKAGTSITFMNSAFFNIRCGSMVPCKQSFLLGDRRDIWDTSHLHGKTGNSSWKIKWFTPFHLGSFENLGFDLWWCYFSALLGLPSWRG